MIYVNRKRITDEYAAGTKVFVYPDKTSSDQLYTFVNQTLGITAKKMVRPDQYHCTVIYSDAACPGAEDMHVKIPMTGGIYDWEIFNSPQFGSCLVGLLNSQDIKALNFEIRNTYGATMRFPTFIPHITVAWGYEGELPTRHPNFAMLFDAYKVAGIDPNWSPNQL